MAEPARALAPESPRPRILPHWPRLMDVRMAALYVSRSETTLRERGPKPKRDGRSVLYDIRDLDRWADQLAYEDAEAAGLPPPAPAAADPADAAAEEERRFFDKRRAARGVD